jgi:hypothetical protein
VILQLFPSLFLPCREKGEEKRREGNGEKRTMLRKRGREKGGRERKSKRCRGEREVGERKREREEEEEV